MEPLQPSDIGEHYRPQVFSQDYSKKAVIDGVKIIDLKAMVDDGGSFMEIARFAEDGSLEAVPGFIPRQASYSLVLPGAIKAFHLHYNQEDVWFVPPTDRLVVGLLDVRKDSPTYQVSMRLALGGGKAQCVYIPRGVAHGGANVGLEPARIYYFVNQQFTIENPDERRLPWDILGEDFWKVQKG